MFSVASNLIIDSFSFIVMLVTRRKAGSAVCCEQFNVLPILSLGVFSNNQ